MVTAKTLTPADMRRIEAKLARAQRRVESFRQTPADRLDRGEVARVRSRLESILEELRDGS